MACPSEEELADFVAGSLSEEARAAIEAHAGSCEACADVLTVFASVYVSDTPETVTLSGVLGGEGESLRPGERIGRFVVLHEIGRGGMGTVHAAYDDALDRRVALKVLSPRRQSEGAEGGLRAEARAMAQLVHPNVVTVLDVGIDPRERLFIAMEYVEGGTLRTWLQAGRSVEAVLSVLVDAARGLAAAHRAGFVHRDFKPDNVLVDAQGHARVTDFGLARAVDGARDSATMVGTPPYMAPEQLEGRDAGPATDVFGWCVTAWEALYGARPFPDGAARKAAIAEGPPSPPSDRRVAPEIHAALVRGLAQDPADRWPSMDALLEVVAARRSPGRAVGWGLAALGVGALAVAATQSFDAEPAARPCLDADAERARVWPQARRLAFETRYAGRVQSVDDYVDDWMAAIEGHCEAAGDDGKTQAELALGAECLRLRGEELGDVIGHAIDDETLEDPGRLISGLSRPGDCNEPSRYLVAEYRYASPAQREATQRVDRLLSRASVASLRGALLEARSLAEEAVEAAREGQREAAWGRALLALADYQTELGDPDAATSLAEALRHATLAGDHGLAFRTVIERMDAIKEDGAATAEEMVWLAELARTHAAAEGSPARKEREVLWRLGYVAWRVGQVREAARIWETMRALDLPDRDEADEIVDSLTVSLLAVSQGRWSAAARSWRAAAEAARLTAPNGVSRLHALHNAAYMTCELGQIAEARALYADAEALAALRTQGPSVMGLDLRIARARCALNLGLSEEATEALAQARASARGLELTAAQRRRLALLDLRLAPQTEGIDLRFAALRSGAVEFGLDAEEENIELEWGLSLLERDRPREARPHLERAHAQSVERVGPRQPITLARKAWLGIAAARGGDDDALGLLDEALEGLLARHEGHTAAILQGLEARALFVGGREPERAAEDRERARSLGRAWGLAPFMADDVWGETSGENR